MSRTRTLKRLAQCRLQVAHLEFWHGEWEQTHKDYVTFSSFSGDTEVHQLLERDPTAADVQWFLTALGVCSCMLRALEKSTRKRPDKWEAWTIPEVLPMYWWSSSKDMADGRYMLVQDVWETLTGDRDTSFCVATYLMEKLPTNWLVGRNEGWNPMAGLRALKVWQKKRYCPCPNKEAER